MVYGVNVLVKPVLGSILVDKFVRVEESHIGPKPLFTTLRFSMDR